MAGQIAWTENFRILAAGSPHSPQTSHGPGLIVYNNSLYVVYVGEGNKNVWFAKLTSTADFHKWEQNQQVKVNGHAVQSSDRPALAVMNNMIYMVYQGQGGTDLWFAWFDGNNWNGNTKLPNGFQQPAGAGAYTMQYCRPSLCVDALGTTLHLVYHAYLVPLPAGGIQNQLLHATFSQGNGWVGPDVVSRDKDHPAILQFGPPQIGRQQAFSLLSTIALNQPGNDALQFATGNPGAWGGFGTLTNNVLSTDGGFLVQFNNLLYIIYIGQSHRNIWYAWMNAAGTVYNGTVGNLQVKEPGWEARTSAAISAAVIGGELCVAYKGQASDNMWFVHGH